MAHLVFDISNICASVLLLSKTAVSHAETREAAYQVKSGLTVGMLRLIMPGSLSGPDA